MYREEGPVGPWLSELYLFESFSSYIFCWSTYLVNFKAFIHKEVLKWKRDPGKWPPLCFVNERHLKIDIYGSFFQLPCKWITMMSIQTGIVHPDSGCTPTFYSFSSQVQSEVRVYFWNNDLRIYPNRDREEMTYRWHLQQTLKLHFPTSVVSVSQFVISWGVSQHRSLCQTSYTYLSLQKLIHNKDCCNYYNIFDP